MDGDAIADRAAFQLSRCEIQPPLQASSPAYRLGDSMLTQSLFTSLQVFQI
jgi:hypothetical protein